jgi:hypothetical protein
VDLEMNRQALRFHTETEIYDLFRMDLDAQAAFNLRQPAFRIHGLVQNDFSEVLGPIIKDGMIAFVNGAEVLVAQADAVLTGLDRALSVANVTVEQLRVALEQTRAQAYGVWQAQAGRAAQRYEEAVAAYRSREAAYRLWRDTPTRQVALKAQRRVAWVSWVATHTTRAAVYAAASAAAEGARRIYVAIPAPDQSVLVQQAAQAVETLRAQVAAAQDSLRTLRDNLVRLDEALAGSGTAFAVQRAEVNADLEAMRRGEAVSWSIAGTFLDRPFTIERSLNFADVTRAAGELLGGLLGWSQ